MRGCKDLNRLYGYTLSIKLESDDIVLNKNTA